MSRPPISRLAPTVADAPRRSALRKPALAAAQQHLGRATAAVGEVGAASRCARRRRHGRGAAHGPSTTPSRSTRRWRCTRLGGRPRRESPRADRRARQPCPSRSCRSGIETRFSGDTLLDPGHPRRGPRRGPRAGADRRRGRRPAGRSGARCGAAAPPSPRPPSAEREAWVAAGGGDRQLARASWVADQTAPTGGTRPAAPVAADQPLPDPPVPRPPRRAVAWSRAAEARHAARPLRRHRLPADGTGGTASWTEIARAWGGPVDDSRPARASTRARRRPRSTTTARRSPTACAG